MRSYVFVVFVLLLSFTNSVEAKNKPDLIKHKPVMGEDYVGVTDKNNNSENYRFVVRENTLAKRSSKSVFSRFENYGDYKKVYDSQIKSFFTEVLKGYEMVDSWETKTEYFVSKPDIKTIVNQCTTDAYLRRTLKKTKEPEGDVLIQTEEPQKNHKRTFFIYTEEKNFGTNINPKVLKKTLEDVISSSDYKVVYNKDKADYIITVTTNTRKNGKEGRMKSAELYGKIKVVDAKGYVVFEKPIKIKGKQVNYNSAGMDAYNNLIIYTKRQFVSKLKELIK